MNVSAKTEYACIAVLELAARHESPSPVRVRTIAESHGIPPQFLVQILLQLKSAGLVVSTRGASGGYRLAKDPADITLCDVMQVMEGSVGEPASSAARETPTSRTLLDVWRQAHAAERELLGSVTFAELASRARGSSQNMYYI